MLDGEPTERWLQDRAARRDGLRRDLERATEEAAGQQAAVGEATAALALRRETEASEIEAAEGAERALEAALAALPTNQRARVEGRWDEPLEDPAALRTRRDGLRGEQDRAEATAADRRARWSAHRQTPPQRTAAEAAAAAEAARTRAEATRTEVATRLAALQADDEARRRRAELEPRRARQAETTRRWEEMADLIGSADGKKLRSFAQALSLDVLVARANHHLGTLRPRYRLRRAPGADMELEVVDGDMGDEIRPVASLSGGETFLVSLALALGLSDLSSRAVAVESLFVDEGFGALDPESLDVALAALDQLQASGRTVALVSHVPEVAERLGYEVRVRPIAPGTSRVDVRAP